jgi:pilus assembly protein Flp/PilA
MKETFRKLSVKLKSLLREEGQDLIEYALVVALIAFGASVGMKSVATGLNTAFNNISTALTTDTGTITP